jgi:hypothetical protein
MNVAPMAKAFRNAASVFSGACPDAPRCAMTSTTPLSFPQRKAFAQHHGAQEVPRFEANPYSCRSDKNNVNIPGQRIFMYPFSLLPLSNCL